MFHLPRFRLRGPLLVLLLTALILVSYYTLHDPSWITSDLDHDLASTEGQDGERSKSAWGLIQDRVVYSRDRKEELVSPPRRGGGVGRVAKGTVQRGSSDEMHNDASSGFEDVDDNPVLAQQRARPERLPSSSSNAGHGQPFIAGEGITSNSERFGGLGSTSAVDLDEEGLAGGGEKGGVGAEDDMEEEVLGKGRASGWMGKATHWAAGAFHQDTPPEVAQRISIGSHTTNNALHTVQDAAALLTNHNELRSVYNDDDDAESSGMTTGRGGEANKGRDGAGVEEKVDGAIMPRMTNETLKAELGRATWKFLHTLTLRYPLTPTPTERTTLHTFFTTFSLLYPCGECASHFQTLLKEFPVQTSSRKAASEWLCVVHNRVNARLGKEEFDCAALGEVYDCGCGDEEVGTDGGGGTTSAGALSVDTKLAEVEDEEDVPLTDVNSGNGDEDEEDEVETTPSPGYWINPKSNLLSGLTDPNGLLRAAQNRVRAGKQRAADVAAGIIPDLDDGGEEFARTAEEGAFGSGIMGFEEETIRQMLERDARREAERTEEGDDQSVGEKRSRKIVPDKEEIAKRIREREEALGLVDRTSPDFDVAIRGQAATGKSTGSIEDSDVAQTSSNERDLPEVESHPGMRAIIEAKARRLALHRAKMADEEETEQDKPNPASQRQASGDKSTLELESEGLTQRQRASSLRENEQTRSGELVTGVGGVALQEGIVAPPLRDRLLDSSGAPLPPSVVRNRGRPQTGNRPPRYPSSVTKKTDGGWLTVEEGAVKSHPLGVLLEEGRNANKFGFAKYYEEEKVEIEPFAFTQEEGDEAVDVKE